MRHPRIIPLNQSDQADLIDQAVKTLNQGGLIIYPTDTCYGLGVAANNPKAVDKLLTFKGQRGNKPVSVLVGSVKQASRLVHINPTGRFYYQHYLPGPFTIISTSQGQVDKRLTPTNTLGIRIPQTPFITQTALKLDRPITATSANQSNKPAPYSIDQFLSQTDPSAARLVDLIINAGPLPRRPASTIIDTTTPQVTIKRFSRPIFLVSHLTSFDSIGVKQTITIGHHIGQLINQLTKQRSVLVILTGLVGAGKTHLTKGLAKSCHITSIIRSASFNLVKEYQGKKIKLIHTDLWRLTQPDPVSYLGLQSHLQPNHWLVIEWSRDRLEVFYPLAKQTKAEVFLVDIDITNSNRRRIYLYQSQQIT